MNEKEYAMYKRLQDLLNAARAAIGIYNELAADWNSKEAKTDDERFPYYALKHADTFRELHKT